MILLIYMYMYVCLFSDKDNSRTIHQREMVSSSESSEHCGSYRADPVQADLCSY